MIGKLYHRVTDLEISLKDKEYELNKLKAFCTEKLQDLDNTISQEVRLMSTRLEDVEKTTLDLIHENEDTFFLEIKKLKGRFEEIDTDDNNNRYLDNFSPRSTLLQSPSSSCHNLHHLEDVEIKTEKPDDFAMVQDDAKSVCSQVALNHTLKVHGRLLGCKLMELSQSSRQSEFTFPIKVRDKGKLITK